VSDPGDTPDYLRLSLGQFLDLVASEGPAPAGGSVAAVAVALAAGLSAMAARRSTAHFADASKLATRSNSLRTSTAPLAQADAIAYGRVLSARREGNVHDALSQAADVPLAVAEAGAEVAEISSRLAREGNPNLEGDAIAAALLAEAAVRATARLVRINLSSTSFEDGRLARAEELVEAASSARSAAEDGRQGTSSDTQ
jgi:methenyltetrahydrofolate cyclohydrolase